MTNKVVLITGASGAIGKAIAILFAKEKHDVIIHYNTSTNKAINLQKELKMSFEGRYILVKADVRLKDEVHQMIDVILKSFSKIDVLVNCAGITRDKTFMKMSREMWEEVIDVNLNGTFNVTKVVVPQMVEQHQGAVINISSVVAQRGNFGQTNYAASKAGIIGFTRALAKELAPLGITVNAVAPGFIDTPMTQQIPVNIRSRLTETIPMKKFGTPDDVADTVLFLARAHYITGEVISVNGGMI